MLTTFRKPKSVKKASRGKKLWTFLFLFVAVIYAGFCPALNEPLYEFLAVHPYKDFSDEYKPIIMGNCVGEHMFFPVLNNPGERIYLHGVYFKTKVCTARGTVIINPSNSYNLTNYINCKPALTVLEMGYNVFFYDYEGFGHSEGTASYKKLGNDGLSAYEFVRQSLATPIVLYGMSMGTGVSAYVAARVPVDGVILDSPFVSPEVTLKEWIPLLNVYPTQMFSEPRYDNSVFVKGKHPPLLILTKGQDITCSPRQGVTLGKIASAPATSIFMPDSAHCYVAVTDAEMYVKAMRKFLGDL